jgi:hypothetical protein
MSLQRVEGLSVGLLAVASIAPARATLPTVTGQLNYVDDDGVGPRGNGTAIGDTGFYTGGLEDSIGALSLTPVSGRTVTATHGSSTINVLYLGQRGGAFPHQVFRNIPFSPVTSPSGYRTLTITNPGRSNSRLVTTESDCRCSEIPPPQGATVI